MYSILRKLTVVFALFLLVMVVYEFQFKDSAVAWKNHSKPQAASYLDLEGDQEILKELQRQTQYSSYKVLDPLFFSKPTIFNPIQTR